MPTTVSNPPAALPNIVPPQIVPRPGRRGEYELTCALTLPLPRSEVFAFFGDALQLERITPPWLHFHVLTPAPIDMHPGTLIDYRLRLHGIPLRWRTEISEWDPPFRFVDRQLRGPYKYWHHEHTFEEVPGGTLVRDRVTYAPPGGALAHRLLVRRDLLKIFTYRQQAMCKIL